MDKILDKLFRLLTEGPALLTTANSMRLFYTILITEMNYAIEKLHPEVNQIMYGQNVHDSDKEWPGNSKKWFMKYKEVLDEWKEIDIDKLPERDFQYEGVLYSTSLLTSKQEKIQKIFTRKLKQLIDLIWEINVLVYTPSEERIHAIYNLYKSAYLKEYSKIDEKELEAACVVIPRRNELAQRIIKSIRERYENDLYASGFLDVLCEEFFGRPGEYPDGLKYKKEQYDEALRGFYDHAQLDNEFVMHYIAGLRFDHSHEQRMCFFRYEHIVEILNSKYGEKDKNSSPSTVTEDSIRLSEIFDSRLRNSPELSKLFVKVMVDRICHYTSLSKELITKSRPCKYRWWHVRRALVKCGFIGIEAKRTEVAQALADIDGRSTINISQVLKDDPKWEEDDINHRLTYKDSNLIDEIVWELQVVQNEIQNPDEHQEPNIGKGISSISSIP